MTLSMHTCTASFKATPSFAHAGISAKPVNRPILSLNRKPKSRVESALNPIDLTVLAEYHEQIESNLQRIERKNQRTWYSKPRSEMGVTCVGRQKMKLGSKPLI